MAADSTLVRASLRENISAAGADVPNLKPLYDSNVRNMKSYVGIVTGAIDAFKKEEQTLKIGKDNQIKGFKNIVRKGRERLAAGETMPQKLLDAVDAKIRALQDEFEAVNTYGKGDTAENEKARIRINARLQKVIGQAVQNRAVFLQIGDSIDNWNHGEISNNIIAPQEKMMNLDNIDRDVDTNIYFNDNDKLVYSTKNYNIRPIAGTGNFEKYGPEVSYTLEQMLTNIGQKDVSADAEIVRQTRVVKNRGLEHGRDPDQMYNYDKDLEKSEFLNTIKTEEDFRNIARRPIEGLSDLSFRDGLIDNVEISFDILDNMFYDNNGVRMNVGEAFKGLDLEPDGVINAKDFNKANELSGLPLQRFKANKKEFLNALTDINHPAFDFNRSKSLIGDYFNGIKEQDYKNAFKRERAKLPLKQGEAWEGSYKSLPIFSGQRFLDYDTGLAMLNSIRQSGKGQATSFGLFDSFYSFNPKTKTWFGETIEQEKGLTTTQLITNLGLTKPEFTSLKGKLPPLSPPPPPPEEKEINIPEAPSRGLTSPSFETQKGISQVIGELYDLYKGFGDFKYEESLGNLVITSPDGKDSINVNMDRKAFGSPASKQIQDFINKHIQCIVPA